MTDIAVNLTSGPTVAANITKGATVNAEVIATGPVAALPIASADTIGGIKVGENLKITDGVLSVDTATAVEGDNTKPITSAAVHTEVGNIEVLLAAL